MGIFVRNETKESEIVTTLEILDLYCAAYAHACGVRLLRVVSGEAGRCSFEFVDDGKASKCLGEWRQRKAFVSARDYAEALRLIKRLIFMSNRQNGITGEIGYESAQSTRTR